MTWCSQINKLIIITIKLGSAQLCPGPTESESGGLQNNTYKCVGYNTQNYKRKLYYYIEVKLAIYFKN